jgi:Cu(I)/Ag(I) efflux system membrane fusion protein
VKRAILVLIALALAIGAYWAGERSAHRDAQVAPASAPAAGPAAAPERKVLYWHDPMVPQQKFDKPGKSPFMDMQLVPVYADEALAESGVSVSAQAQQNLGIRLAPAEVTALALELRATGYVQADERGIARAEVRSTGWVEKLHVRSLNDPVRAGQVLAEIYSPDLLAAQEEYLLTRRMAQANAGDAALAQDARRRLELLGMPAQGIARLDSGGAAERRVPLLAPISGVVSELAVREGAMVQAGAAAFTITDLSSVWVSIEVPEARGAVLRQGVSATATVRTLPGKTFAGRLDYVYPEVNAQTRTLRARIVLANPGLALKPGMFADVQLASGARKSLTVPTEAVIQTGTRSVVIVAEAGRFRPAQVRVGAEAQGRSEILKGLKAGEQVVVSGQFLIDSEAGLRGALERLQAPGGEAVHKGTGKVTAIDRAASKIELAHDPIASLKWPAMTMEFALRDKAQLGGLKAGDRVEFELRSEPGKEGDYVIESLRRLP